MHRGLQYLGLLAFLFFKAIRARMAGRFHDARRFADEFYAIGQRVGGENSALLS